MYSSSKPEPDHGMIEFGPMTRDASSFLLLAIYGMNSTDIYCRREYLIDVGRVAVFSETGVASLKLRLWTIACEVMDCAVRVSPRQTPSFARSGPECSAVCAHFFSAIQIGQGEMSSGECRNVRLVFNPMLINVFSRIRAKLEQRLIFGFDLLPDQEPYRPPSDDADDDTSEDWSQGGATR